MGLIGYPSFESFFIRWAEGMVVSVGGKVINIDGKKRSTAWPKGFLRASSAQLWTTCSRELVMECTLQQPRKSLGFLSPIEFLYKSAQSILLDIFHTTPQRHDGDKTKSFKIKSLCRRGVV